jgi:hypothetical protein
VASPDWPHRAAVEQLLRDVRAAGRKP